MNKQELIEVLNEWKTFRKKEGQETVYYQLAEVVNLVEQLDEPQKPVVPKIVVNLVDWTIKMQYAPSDVIRDLHDNGDLANLPRDLELDKLSEYFDKAYCRYNFEKACFVGYVVEKEPLWGIKNADGNYLTKCALWGKDGVNYSFECNPSYRLLFTDKATADAAALLVTGTVEEVVEG
ncbi:hypothetical protein [Enterococcus hirae]|uniref:hypothetical protein n=1 Tax=Enterococcus hirae TaxID=1354 RepID=UPI0006B14F88|nr:hypothetical protein [Enterococcus hirae]